MLHFYYSLSFQLEALLISCIHLYQNFSSMQCSQAVTFQKHREHTCRLLSATTRVLCILYVNTYNEMRLDFHILPGDKALKQISDTTEIF